MKKDVKRLSMKKRVELKQRRALTTSHILIAVVALIECLILISFTTYSWIESSSSLIIMNGRQSTAVPDIKENYVDLKIADELSYRVNLPENLENATFSDINRFFSEVEYYEFAKGTSADGKTFFFPRRNNTNANSSAFRKGDTTDYNTSYYYFDFVIKNDTSSGKDFFFDAENCFTVGGNKTIFDVTGGDSVLSETFTTSGGDTITRLEALRRAMRISVTSQIGSGTSDTTILSVNGTGGYNSISPSVTSATDSDISTPVTTQNVTDYIYATENNAIVSHKLFNARRNQETKVSIRIWFDMLDPDFQSAFGFSTSSGEFDTQLFKAIPSADIGMKFALFCTNNDYQPVYFDDYTFSTASGSTHMTDEHSNYRMWFYAYQPETTTPPRSISEGTAGLLWMKMSKDSSSSTEKNRWITSDATQSMMSADTTEYPQAGMSSSHINDAKFVYAPEQGSSGTPNLNAAGVYTWTLPAAPTSDYYYFDAYSYTAYGNISTKYGVGVWDDSDANSMLLLKFKDVATGVSAVNYNNSSTGNLSFEYINDKAETDSTKNYVFANNSNVGTAANNYTLAVAKTTAAMYYDAENHEFKSYVPKKWLEGSAAGVYFNYCPNGYFNLNATAVRWYGAGPNLNYDSQTYTFSALGAITNGYLTEYYKNNANNFAGVGTWGQYEEIKFSTELIDTTNLAAYRHFVGIQGYSSGAGWNYYPMIPNYDHTSFSAYVPAGLGVSSAQINFQRYSDYKGANGHNGAINAYWYGNIRHTSSTFYPVTVNGAASSGNNDYTRGYWNVSVLVDGTYKNLIYDTLTDDVVNDVGTLAYSYDEENWTTIADDLNDTFNNKLDRYRFYAPAENYTTVYWRWMPYDAGSYTVDEETYNYEQTVFYYEHDTSTGIYKLITEPESMVTDTGIPSGHTGDWPTEAAEP